VAPRPAAVRRAAGSAARPQARASPSFSRTSALTACGLALPPVAFITWPTNQPASAGLACACATLSGLAAITSSTAASMAPVSVTWRMPRASTIAPGRRPRSRGSRTRPWRSCRRSCRPIRSSQPRRAGQAYRAVSMERPSLFSRPNSSLMTQFAACLPSRPSSGHRLEIVGRGDLGDSTPAS
jgi:hypothetical protein